MSADNDLLPALTCLGLIHSARKAGLNSLSQLRAVILLGNGSRTITELAGALGLSWTGTAELVEAIEAAGLVQRHRSLFRRRGWHVELTAAGRRLLTAKPSPAIAEPC